MFFRRLFAFLVDKFLLSSLVLGIAVLLRSEEWTILHGLASLSAFALYRAAAHSRWGATLGKAIVGLQVTRDEIADGGTGPLSFNHALFRELPILLAATPELLLDGGVTTSLAIRFLALAGTLFMLGEIWSAFTDPRNRALHDKLAGTVLASRFSKPHAAVRELGQ